MARIAVGNELNEINYYLGKAKIEANRSSCKKDKRGVLIVNYGRVIRRSVNTPPEGYVCDLEKYCKQTYKDYAIHVEMNAIIDAVINGFGNQLKNARMYHVRLDKTNGKIADSRKPRCYPCSKHIFAFGIGEFVLKHKKGITIYSSEEFNRLSLENFLKR